MSILFTFIRFASKESDRWIRGLIKDLTFESGSGLIVLDPVDISGGYTSFKEKINISFLSTDICLHLSLSVLSLLLNLHSQATAALQFGNADPLYPCTNFERVWVSPKGISFSPVISRLSLSLVQSVLVPLPSSILLCC